MRSLQIVGAGQLDIVEAQPELLYDNAVRVQVNRVGLCGTDFALSEGTLGLNTFPVIPGHEVAGIVVESRSPALGVGTNVALNPLISCGTCWACRDGHPQWCSEVGVVGVIRNGGLQEEIVLPDSFWVRLPDDLPLEQGVLVEPLHVVETVLSASNIAGRKHVLLIGTGALGIMLLKVLKGLNPECEIWVHDNVPERLRHAEVLGGKRWEWSDMKSSVDVVIDGVGSPESMKLASLSVRPGGHIVVYGVPKPGTALSGVDMLFRNNIRLSFARLYTHDFTRAVNWAAKGMLRTEDVVSDVLNLEEAVEFLRLRKWKTPERWGKVIVQIKGD